MTPVKMIVVVEVVPTKKCVDVCCVPVFLEPTSADFLREGGNVIFGGTPTKQKRVSFELIEYLFCKRDY